MHARKVTLVEIGAGGLPAVTPVTRRRSSWFPMIYTPPAVPPVGGVTPNPVADGVLIEWAAVDQEGVIYIIERGPSQEGPWTEIHRTTETRYLYSNGSGLKWWFRITASVRGKAGDGTVVEGEAGRVPSYAEMEELNRKIGQEVIERLAGDLAAVNEATGQARAYTDAQVAALNGILEDIVGADEWTAEADYPAGDFVRHAGLLYRALHPSTGVEPGTDRAVWEAIGDYTSVGDALAASISMSTQNASDIAAEATRVDAVVARMPAGAGALATAAQVATEQQARADADAALGERINTTNAALGDKASIASVNAVEQASVARDSALGQRIDSTNSELAGKASSDALQQLRSEVVDLEGVVDATSEAVTQVRSQIGGAGNMLVNASFEADLRGWQLVFDQWGIGAPSRNPAGDGYRPAATATIGWGGGGVPTGLVMVDSDAVAVTPGKRYCLSAYLAAHRCQTYAQLFFLNAAGQVTGVVVGTAASAAAGGGSLANWPREHVIASAPADAVTARVRLISANANGQGPIAFFLRPQLEEMREGQVGPSPWQAGAAGLDTKFAAATQSLSVRATQLENGQSQLQASYTWALDVNGRVIGMTSVNNGTIGRIDFVADIFSVVDPGNTGSTTFEQGRWITRSGGYMLAHGKPFGTTGDLMMWLGIGSNPANASKGNGLFWIDNKGNSYFGGSLSAGVLRNAVQTTTLQTVGAELVNGPFTTNGNTRQVTIGFSRTVAARKTAPGTSTFVAGAGANTATVQVYRQIGNGAEAWWQTLNVTGDIYIQNETDGPDYLSSTWGGSLTVNDASSPNELVRYRAIVTAFTAQQFSHTSGSFDSQVVTQNLSIVSVE